MMVPESIRHSMEGETPHEIKIVDWSIRRDGEEAWQPIAVPGCWEDAGRPADDPGPFTYRSTVDIPPAFAGRRLWLRFQGVSYDCTVCIDGRPVGRHVGTWDPFEIEITRAAAPGRRVELTVRVEKPASPTAGPGSPTVTGRFALRETLSGFLPYVWGHAFGGLWQDVTLFSTGRRRLLPDSLYVAGTADGHVTIEGECVGRGKVAITLESPHGEPVIQADAHAAPGVRWTGVLPDPQPWSPDHPVLYTARVSLPEGDECRVRFGLRSLATEGSTIVLNGRPVYPRLALSWGWTPGKRCPNPGTDWVRARLAGLREMGFNGVKLCLWVPPAYFFDLADEMGMLLWLELPMWLPAFTPHFRRQTPVEYERLVRMARGHPSVILYTLGCELNRDVDASFLSDLYTRLKGMAGQALVRDNSGSGEAYGGWLAESADFYDHHFYCELQFLRPLLASFAPWWRERQPWLMGEFCDYDAIRDWPALLAAHAGRPPWWADPSAAVNPQGARWEMRAAGQAEKLQATGLESELPTLIAAARRQGLLHRKLTLETVRTRPDVSGYVLTGEVDTPISTAGLWDDLGVIRYDPDTLRAFNDDLILMLGHLRRREWVAGGDRPLYIDRFNAGSKTMVRMHILVSNYGRHAGEALLSWEARLPGEMLLAAGESPITLSAQGGQVGELLVLQFLPPEVEHPLKLEIRARLQAGGRVWSNRWPVWIYPARPWHDVSPFTLFDPAGELPDLLRLAGGCCEQQDHGRELGPDRVAVCTAWGRGLDRFVAGGGRVVLIQQKHGPPGPLPAVECSFWREACKLVIPHPAWGDFPHDNDPGLQFYSLATDCALDASGMGDAVSPLLRRLDTRGPDMLEYACLVPWGRGRLLATTLRFQGGLGDQPNGIARSPAAEWLLAEWIRWLHAQG